MLGSPFHWLHSCEKQYYPLPSMPYVTSLVLIPFLYVLFIFSFGISKPMQNRCGFEGKGEIWVEDILNLGVS